jgi:Zn-dependent peptidase ImmA (M78 family)
MAIRTADQITEAVTDLRRRCGQSIDPPHRGPVPLDRFFQAENLTHAEVSRLSAAAVINHLVTERFVTGPHVLTDITSNEDRLDGFLFWAGSEGLAFVNADDILPRRRFTAAHELGHAVLHRDKMGRYRADAKVEEAAEPSDELEREANRFAVELLMPAEVCRAREAELKDQYAYCPRGVLAYLLASELLVSREAMRYRLKNLRVGDE